MTGQDVSAISVIDTIWLAPLARPDLSSHALEKTYQTEGRIAHNDPREDARLAVELLCTQVQELKGLEARWLRALHWLCTLGSAHKGYAALFQVIRPGASGSPDDLRQAPQDLLDLFDGQVCRCGLQDQLAQAYRTENGWPLAWTLSWYRNRDRRAAPAVWLLESFPEFRAVLDDLGRRRCSEFACTHCRNAGTTLDRMACWFPPEPGTEACFQPPFDLDSISFQERVMEAGIARRNILGILPTGTGKSRCFQVPALEHHARTGDLTVVISPLKALMRDQVQKAMANLTVGVECLHGDMDQVEQQKVAEAIQSGQTALLYISPERLGSAMMKALLSSRRIGLWVFDEAHCLTSWGNTFRGDYRRAVKWLTTCGASGSDSAAVMCLTATARPETQRDIQTAFETMAGRKLTIIDGGAHRPNLTYRVVEGTSEGLEAQVKTFLGDKDLFPPGSQAIVYALRRESTETLAESLRHAGYPAEAYHAHLNADRKRWVERAFASGEARIIVATIAFGMGVDTPNVRLVIHTNLPSSLEAYAQEAGRGGRDRKPANCVLIQDPDDLEQRFEAIAKSHLDKEEIDAVWGHIVEVHRRVQEASKSTQLMPPLSLPYVTVARSVLGLAASQDNERTMERARDRINRIIDALEAAGLVEKLHPSPSLEHFRVDAERLAEFSKLEHTLPRLQARIVSLIKAKADETPEADDIRIPAATREALAELCGLTHPDRENHISRALRSLVKKKLLRREVSVQIALSTKGFGEASLNAALDIDAALLRGIEQLLEMRTPAAPESDSVPDGEPGFMLHTTISEVWNTAREFYPAERVVPPSDDPRAETAPPDTPEPQITPRDIVEHLHALHRGGLLRVKISHVSRSGKISISAQHDIDTAVSKTEHRRRQLQRVLATLRELTGGGQRLLHISPKRLAEEVAGFDIDLDQVWRNDGDALDPEQAEIIAREALLRLSETGTLDVGPGLYHPAEECRVMVVKRPGALRKDSFTKVIFERGVGAFQQEEIRQLHLLDGYARQVLTDHQQAPDLLKSYFATPSQKALGHVVTGKELELALENRPASVARQIELQARLDERQASIVFGDTSLKDTLILAGPGSGKTRVIVERIVWLVSVERVPPDQILALCYNRRAAEEIRTRLKEERALGRLGTAVSVSTYHAFALQVLGLSYDRLFDKAVAEEAEMSQGRADRGNEAAAFDSVLEEGGRRLAEHRRSGGNLSDIMLRRYRWVFVDEFQDVSEHSFNLIREISQQSQKKVKSQAQTAEDLIDVRFCAVGDDDQNIYDFGGASSQYIRAFGDLFPGAEMPELTWNYRSSGAILKVAADIIASASGRLKTTPIEIDPARRTVPLQGRYYSPENPDIGRVSVRETEGQDIESQAPYAASELLHLAKSVPKEIWRWDATAVLVRNRAHIRIVERALSEAGIEVSRDLKGLVPLLRVKEAIKVRDWLEAAEHKGRWLAPDDLRKAATWVEGTFASRWSRAVAEKLESMASEIEVGEPRSAREISDEFVEWAKGWQPVQTGVVVLTAHSAKGLEFDNVVVLDAGWLQHPGSTMNDPARRLLYVAATRARHSLSFITSREGRRNILGDCRRGDHLLDRDCQAIPPVVVSRTAHEFEPCSVRDVFLSFPAFDGHGCNQTDDLIDLNAKTIGSLKTGDQLVLRWTGENDQLPWHLFRVADDGSGIRIGKMRREFDPDFDQREIPVRVFAIVRWRHCDSQEHHKSKIKRKDWFTIVPELRIDRASRAGTERLTG
ncbi:RecQ family ATP-dependent DNA helicase [Microvirga yunnanensis]|uniref:RecQ family ATP-dependent DNA helicase n=1 Tax=Microvirga yunnanensis TaxID=2953740 RepID=UPI0021C8F011|nr:RecQ family ATP-dependent DNA helicase [Microvirga sp. HBU65207]